MQGNTMIDPKAIDDLVKRLMDAVPPSLLDLKSDLQDNFRSALQGGLAKLDLVTREEFDAQLKVLARTRSKLETLEKKVDAMERGEAPQEGANDLPPG